MVQFDVNKIKHQTNKNYEKTWTDTGSLLPRTGRYFTLKPKGKPHILFDLIVRIRSILLNLGFEEVILPIIVDDKEVVRQYGPEGNVILDRVFYLAGLPRPDIGISKELTQQITKIVPGFKHVESLKTVFRRYKRGEIEADDLLETIVTTLNVQENEATRILNLFPEFKNMRPVPMNLTLRSHTTASWFPALKQLKDRQALPLQLFSIGQKFRREQRLDATHLLESWTASIVIMAEEISLEDTQQIIKELLERLGHSHVKFVIKQATSKYYAPQTEFEVFIPHPSSGDFLEVGDGGFYSPVSLAQYNIPYPVFNCGFGLERLLMIEKGIPDIREVVYPYQYTDIVFSDTYIANNLEMVKKPRVGDFLVEHILRVAHEHASDPSPCRVQVYVGAFMNSRISIQIVENEVGQQLLGAAAFNPIIIKDSAIIGSPSKRILEGAVDTGLTYMDGIASLVVHGIEQAIEGKEEYLKVRISLVKRLADINLKIGDHIRRYIESKNAKIDVRGPVFAEFNIKIFYGD